MNDRIKNNMSVVGSMEDPEIPSSSPFDLQFFLIGIQMATACCLTGIHLCDIYCN